MSIQKMTISYIIVFMFLIGILSFFKNNKELISLASTHSSDAYDTYVSKELSSHQKDIEKLFANNGFDITLLYEDEFSDFFEEMYVDIY